MLPPRYDPKAAEAKWLDAWEKDGLFRCEPSSPKTPYVIAIPPPNITGVLHIGHALNNTLQDILIRWRRMEGRDAFWIPGTDHAGIATQNVVERELAKGGRRRQELGRKAFLDEVWAWKKACGGTIVRQLKRLGCSCDWERERFTMDEGLTRAVREAFVRLYEKGLIHRGKYIVNWCPRCRTALSDDEVEGKDEPAQGHLWHIRYPFEGGKGGVTVATTRPETMLGDTAVAVNPKDPRYAAGAGQSLLLPLVGRRIPLIADAAVDAAFGTGAVKVTPAHDAADFEIGGRHGLASIVIMDEGAVINENGIHFRGMDRYACRKAIVAELEAKGFLEKIEPYELKVGRCYRCGTVIEPYLSDQWFVRMGPLAKEAAKATRAGKVRFHPERWEKVYLSWLDNVRDWCVSRQIWWGHRIPVFYCLDCNAGKFRTNALGETRFAQEAVPIVAREDPAACPSCGGGRIAQDEDVLDTWFSSALWPFSTLGWPEETPLLRRYYPTSTLVTARGIIYFWVARMAMAGLCLAGREPFSDVYIHGTILDEKGEIMSKTKGNGIDPLIMMDGGAQPYCGRTFTSPGYGADGVRFSLILLATEGQDLKLAPERFDMGRNFLNKIWNAARLVMIHLDPPSTFNVEETTDHRPQTTDSADPQSAIRNPQSAIFEDRWILGRLRAAIEETTRALERFRFSEALKVLYDFAWHDFCDWYLEIVKPRLAAPAAGDPVREVLAGTLGAILRLLHPFIPFITEEIGALLRERAPSAIGGGLVIHAPWPRAEEFPRDAAVEEEMEIVIEAIRAVRNLRAQRGLAPKAKTPALVRAGEKVGAVLGARADWFDRLASSTLAFGPGTEKPEGAIAEVTPRMEVYLPLPAEDREKERERLRKELDRSRTLKAEIEARLSDANFASRAAPAVVDRERRRLAETDQKIAGLEKNLG